MNSLAQNPEEEVDNTEDTIGSLETLNIEREEAPHDEQRSLSKLDPNAAHCNPEGISRDGRVPELLELALQQPNCKCYFDTDIFRALRLTSRKFKDIVETTVGALTYFKFGSGDGNLEDFDAYLEMPKSTTRVEKMLISGRIIYEQATKFVLLDPPNLTALDLDLFDSGLPMLRGQFKHLRWFHLRYYPGYVTGEVLNRLAKVTWPLQELSISIWSPVNIANLAAVLENFPELRVLKLGKLSIFNKSKKPIVPVQCLSKLHHLEINNVSGINHLSLFSPTMKFPCLDLVVIDITIFNHPLISTEFIRESMDWCEVLTACDWIKQLVVMEFACNVSLTSEQFKALMSSLHGDPLQTLLFYNPSILSQDWNCAYLPKLKRLKLNFDIPDLHQKTDFFEWFSALSSAHMPALETLLIKVEWNIPSPNLPPFSELTKSLDKGLDRFMKAFPHLSCFRISFGEEEFDASPMYESKSMVEQLFGEEIGQIWSDDLDEYIACVRKVWNEAHVG